MCGICSAMARPNDANALATKLSASQISPLKDADAPIATGLTDQHADNMDLPLLLTEIAVDGAHIEAAIDMIGDQDFFRVDLVAGQTYAIGQYMTPSGPLPLPLADAYLELYDSAGNLVASADGGGPNTPSGLDALLTFTATQSGTYYINARAYDELPDNGSTGDFVGSYELFVDTVEAAPGTYVPFYDINDDPMHSIDWGAVIDRTSRNPDGNNGTRPNPRAPDGGAPSINNTFGIEGKNVVTYYFARQGDIFVDEGVAGLGTMVQAENMEQWEKDAFRKAFDLYEQVADIVYIEVASRDEADFKLITYEGTPGVGASLLGRMSPPNTPNEGQTEMNEGDARWTPEGVSQGGFFFSTILHEFGHGHGMAHPHDNGGRSSVMPGADGGTGGLGGGYGDWGLSQRVFTVMSYNSGWYEDAPFNAAPAGHGGPRSGGITGTEVDHYGWMGTLGALDIAVIQDKYGVNEEWATGDDVYQIKDFNGAGNFYATIWDGGGTDEIRYDGAADANIDLRAANLQYAEGGGGWMSYALGLWGGFTIANGVTIENAAGGSGDDTLIGNLADNILSGGLGADALLGGDGDDELNGGEGDDVLSGWAGQDDLRGGAGSDTASYVNSTSGVFVDLSTGDTAGGHAVGDTFDSIENLTGSAFDDTLIGTSTANRFDGSDGVDTVSYASASSRVSIKLWEGRGYLGDAEGDTFIRIERVVGSNFGDTLVGSNGADQLHGGGGNDLLTGGRGADALVGGAGTDTASYAGSSARVVAKLTGQVGVGGDAEGDTLASIENLTGSSFGDELGGNRFANRLDGGGGSDWLKGFDGADVLIGGGGDDRLDGGLGDDRFVFRGSSGSDRITDFGAGAAIGDVIQLDGAVFTDFADVLANTTDDGLGNTVIAKGGVQITLNGVLKAQLHENDFDIAAAAPDPFVAAEGKDAGALVLPAEPEDDAFVLPPLDPATEASTDAPSLDPGIDPLILPAGLEGKAVIDEAPVICRFDGDAGLAPARPDLGLVDLGLGDFMGRDPHRFLTDPRALDWIV